MLGKDSAKSLVKMATDAGKKLKKEKSLTIPERMYRILGAMRGNTLNKSFFVGENQGIIITYDDKHKEWVVWSEFPLFGKKKVVEYPHAVGQTLQEALKNFEINVDRKLK